MILLFTLDNINTKINIGRLKSNGKSGSRKSYGFSYGTSNRVNPNHNIGEYQSFLKGFSISTSHRKLPCFNLLSILYLYIIYYI